MIIDNHSAQRYEVEGQLTWFRLEQIASSDESNFTEDK